MIFEVEVAFVYPVAPSIWTGSSADGAGYVLSEILLFLGILFVGLIYVWVKHDLDWLKKVPE